MRAALFGHGIYAIASGLHVDPRFGKGGLSSLDDSVRSASRSAKGLPTLDPSQFAWFRVGGDLELHVMLVDEQPPRRAHFCLVVDGGLDVLRGRLDGAGVEAEDAPLLVGRPRLMCRDPFGNLVELCRLE